MWEKVGRNRRVGSVTLAGAVDHDQITGRVEKKSSRVDIDTVDLPSSSHSLGSISQSIPTNDPFHTTRGMYSTPAHSPPSFCLL